MERPWKRCRRILSGRLNRVQFGSLQAIDSVHTSAGVNTRKDGERQNKKGKPPRDGGATWGVKHTDRERDQEGNGVTRKQGFFGFKAHMSPNAVSGFITSLVVSRSSTFDGPLLPPPVDRHLGVGMPVCPVTADRANDDGT
jgi:hypothetical protein